MRTMIDGSHNTKPDIIADSATREDILWMAKNIKDAIESADVMLFGSRAWGRPRPSSDVDLAVIVDKPLSAIEARDLRIAARVASRHTDVGLNIDVILYTKARFQDFGRGTLAYEIRTKGVRL